jgi:toxin-antitoxin system, toxin component, PIN family
MNAVLRTNFISYSLCIAAFSIPRFFLSGKLLHTKNNPCCIDAVTVAAEAGHAQPSTTLMIYTQQYKRRRASIRNQLSSELYEK